MTPEHIAPLEQTWKDAATKQAEAKQQAAAKKDADKK